METSQLIIISAIVIFLFAIASRTYTGWNLQRTLTEKREVMEKKSKIWMREALRPFTADLPPPPTPKDAEDKVAIAAKAAYEVSITRIAESIAQNLPIQELQRKCDLPREDELKNDDNTKIFDRENKYVNCLISQMWRTDLPEWVDAENMRLFACPALLLCSLATYVVNYGSIYHFEECSQQVINEKRCPPSMKGSLLLSPNTFLSYSKETDTVRIRIWVVGKTWVGDKHIRQVGLFNGWFTTWDQKIWGGKLEDFFKRIIKLDATNATNKSQALTEKLFPKKLESTEIESLSKNLGNINLGVIKFPQWTDPVTLDELRYLLYVLCETTLRSFDWRYPGIWNITADPVFNN